jgi:acyl transferase domain-containing protein/NADPH:quinone reductase-like Zn-dependent oxidoreductase/acyl carrier protein
MACRLPGGIDDAESYWSVLSAGRSVISELPRDRFLVDAVYDPDKAATGLSYSKWGGFLDDVAGFDHGFFGISPREAEAMDPQQRLLLMATYEAMEDAGLTRADLQQVRTGVFVGVSAAEYANLQRYRRTQGDAFTGTGAALSIVANRLSHRFNLKGPSYSIDTACSSSLVALDQACLNLERGNCDIAIVAGVHVLADFGGFVAFSKAGMLSPTGEIAAFDARANGYVRGEGLGVVVLKQESDARSDGNRILARIRATAVNQDGRTPTLTAPDPSAQRAMLETLSRRAGVDPITVDYVEAHGTGTRVGDPIEASAIGLVFGGERRRFPLLVGSVKPNIGHLEPAAGIAGLIKAVLVANKRQVPPNCGFREPNPDIAFDLHNLVVPDRTLPIGQGDQPVLVAVNSFGFGGTNASVLIEAGGQQQREAASQATIQLPVSVPLSAGSPAALKRLTRDTAQAVEASSAPFEAKIAALRSRDPRPWRRTLIVHSEQGLVSGLRELGLGDDEATKSLVDPRLAFTYGGQGGQWWAMGRRLLLEDAAFGAAFSEFDGRFGALAGWSVRETLLAVEGASKLHRSRFAMPALFGLQLGLTAHWTAQGVRPEFVVGHSFGEVAAAVAAGALTLDDATRLIHVRSQIRDRLGRDSAMLVVGAPPDRIEDLVPEALNIDLAAINSARMVTLCGEQDDIAALEQHLRQTRPDHFARRVQSDTAWHSRLLDPLEDWFHEALGDIDCRPPELTFISTVTGEAECRLDSHYWWRNLRQPVRYAAGVERALERGANVLLELSPHRVLTGSNATIAAEVGKPIRAIATLERDKDDFECLAKAAAGLWEAGLDQVWDNLGRQCRDEVRLPRYSWDLTRHWRISEEAKALLLTAPAHTLLGRREHSPGFSWSNEISLVGNAMLADHAVGDSAVFPAAGYLELMLAAGREALGEGTLELENFVIVSALFIGPQDEVFVSTHFDPPTGNVTVHTRLRQGTETWTLRATGLLRLTDTTPQPVPAPSEKGTLYSAEQFYAEASRMGFAYGPAFRTISELEMHGNQVKARLAVAANGTRSTARYLAHPALLDGILQTGLAFAFSLITAKPERLLLPTTIARVVCRAALPERLVVTARSSETDGLGADFAVTDERGDLLLSISGLGMREVPQLAPDRSTTGPHFVVENWSQMHDGPAPSPEPQCRWLIGPGLVDHPHYVALDLMQIEKQLGQSPRIAEPQIVFVAAPARPECDPVASAYENTQALINLGKVLRHSARPAQLTVVTRGARSPDGRGIDKAGLATSPLVGLARTLAAELGNVRVRQIDLGHEDPLELIQTVPTESDETEWAIRGERRWVPRLSRAAPEALPVRVISTTPANGNFALTMTIPGALGDLHHASRDMPCPEAGSVQIETVAVGVNFRDVMAATGLLPQKAEAGPAWWTLGLEFSGIVRQVGPGVVGLKPGDRVFCMGKSAMQAWSVRPAADVVLIPDEMSFSQAASIGTAFATAHYGLEHVARIRRGDRVLIHLGTGGVGLAAIQIARSRGAEVLATAGSEAKREFLHDMGVEHVMNSRGLAFADEVMARTGGEGVDIVLNALSGHAQAKSLSLLRPFGRFLEIGKRDVYDNRQIGLEALARNISLQVIDLAAMNEQRPELLPQIFSEVMEGFASGRLGPLPITSYPAAEAEKAFRLMAQAGHIGKVVLDYQQGPVPVQDRPDGVKVRSDAVYLVTGGTSGFGASVAQWLAEKGAGRIILASRSGRLSEEARPVIDSLIARGSQIDRLGLDVADAGAVEALFASLRRQGAILGGVVHGAAVLGDAMLGQLTRKAVEEVLAPKIRGAWNLHTAIRNHGFEPDIFCCFSSIAETVGSLGQANYVAANAFLEGLARHRRALGLRAQTVGWGPLQGVGMVARNKAMGSYLESVGFKPLSIDDALAALDLVLARDTGNVDYVDADWNRVARATGESVPPRLQGLTRPETVGSQPLWSELLQTPKAGWATLVERMLAREVGLALKLEDNEIDAARPLAELGFDSLSSIELKNRIESQLGCTIPVGAFFGTPTIQSLATQVIALAEERMSQGSAVAAGEAEAETSEENDDAAIRRCRAYWMAHAAHWPRATPFANRRHPRLPSGPPTRFGQSEVMRISLDISESGMNPPTDMQWLEAFGRALACQAGQDSVLVAVVAADGIIPVTVNAQGTIESVRRQLELGGPHASFALNALPDELGLNQSDAWLTQFAFYGQGVGLHMPGHDLAAKVTQSTDGRLDFILAFDGTVLDTTFIRALFDRATACLALRWDGDMQTVSQDEETPTAPLYAADRHLLTPPSDDALITPEASRLLEQIDSDQASSHFRRAWTLSQAIRVAPAVDVTRLQQAVSALTARHESLRIRLAGERGDRRPRLGPADCHVDTHDYRLTPPETYMTVVQELASRPLLPEGETLFEVHLLRFDGFDVVVVKVFEAIADGWSLALICDQLIRAYIGLDLGSPPPSLAQAKTLLAQHPVDTGAIAAFETLPPIPWANVGAPPEAARASPLTLGRSERFTIRLTPAQALFLRDSARALRTNENALLAAAYAKAIAMAGHVDDVLLHVVHPGRSLPALETVVGFLRQSTFVVARSLDNNSLGAAARSIADQFLTMADPGELSDMFAAKKLMADGALSAQALPTRFGYARLLADRTLDGTLMGTLADHQDATISAFSLQIEPLDINLFGLQENRLQLRPLSRADGIDLNFYFDCKAFTLEDVEDIAGNLVGQLLHPAPASTDDTLRPSPALFEREELMSK